METSRIKGSHYPAYFCGALLMIYFLFPHLLLLPYVAVVGKGHEPPDWLRTLFWPISVLCDHVPPYRALIQAESDLTGV